MWPFSAETMLKRSYYQQGLDLNTALGNRAVATIARRNLGAVAGVQGDLTAARHLYAEALVVFQELGDKKNEAGVLGQLTTLTKNEGGKAEAELTLLASDHPLPEEWGIASMSVLMFNLALLYEEQERLDEALPLLEQVVQIDERLGRPDQKA